MQRTAGRLGLTQHLARRLWPMTLGIAILISVGSPITYYALQSFALRRTATLHAQTLAGKLQSLILEAPALWKYQTYKYARILRDSSSGEDVIAIQILDQGGKPIVGYEYTAGAANAWWNLYPPVGSAAIIFNSRAVGSVQIEVSRGWLLGVTLVLFFFSVIAGVGVGRRPGAIEGPHFRRDQGEGYGDRHQAPLTRRLVELQAGKIRMESEGEGRGSTFTFTMPTAEVGAGKAPLATPAAQA